MSRRIDVELTSRREDGTWTWRAAGARQPKGELSGDLLFEGAEVGDVVRAEADFFVDGITITSVSPPKGRKRNSGESLEIIGSGRDFELVTTQLAPKGRGRGRDGDRKGRGRGRDGGRGRGRDRDGDQKGRGQGRGRDRSDARRDRQDDRPPKPKAIRLRPKRAHRNEALKTLPDEQRPMADVLLHGGIPGLRTEIEKQNERAKAEGLPEVNADALLRLAERIYPALRTADWHDRADAAIAGVDTVDLRDLRSVVVAADNAAKDAETRALAAQLRDAVTARVDAEHNKWLTELTNTVAEGRTVRALRLSSRPPKAGSLLPPDLAEKLATSAAEGLTPETSPDRYATVLDAVAFSPVRTQVKPQGIPTKVTDDLTAAVTRLSTRIPEIAALFGIAPTAPPPRGKGGGRGRSRPPRR
ncbi:MAG: hypothetical protein HKN26_10345 [Acidimicrobiales bacterium]|nr:hypothetical protein [Acidimicrobiales bacterium]